MGSMRIGHLTLILYLLLCLPAFAQQDAPATPSDHANPSEEPAAPPPAGMASRPDLTPDAEGRLSQGQMRQLTSVVAQNYRDNFKKQHDYTYIESDVEKTLGGDHQPKSTEAKTYEIIEIYGEQVRRLIERDHKPLDAKEAAKEEERIQKIIDKRKNESDGERKKREETEARRREESRKFVSAVADTYDFKLLGSEFVGERESLVIQGEPRPGFEPHDKDSKFLAKFHGRLWIDKIDLQLAKMDVEAIDTVSVGWVLARIHKGTRFMYEQARINDEIWLPKHLTYALDARVALFKGYNVEGEQIYRDYKKFRTTSKIVEMGEVKDQQKDQ